MNLTLAVLEIEKQYKIKKSMKNLGENSQNSKSQENLNITNISLTLIV